MPPTPGDRASRNRVARWIREDVLGKKILEWSITPQYAHRTVRTLNNRNPHDSRDPNSCGKIASMFGSWDSAREERDAHREVHAMTATGLERRAESDEHAWPVEELTGPEVRR